MKTERTGEGIVLRKIDVIIAITIGRIFLTLELPAIAYD